MVAYPRATMELTDHPDKRVRHRPAKCGCGCETKALAPDGVTAPVQYGPRLMGTGIGALEALTSAFQGRPWIPETG